ncbi:flagellar assembly protein H [Enhygromyxa salina]|uniref:Flagellar assembly protein H n=1 Tax=Enhygromyxa salina TaxID=215803 RepID=A0A2S9YFP6_9BACT|nr:hypothetical protein [Enhygromyxa salina]PRQ03872.1 flagellar assembly protein H [Enhygromyxa salina]
MPGTLHQGVLSLFRDDPWLGFDLLQIDRPVIGTPVDRRGEIDRDAKQHLRIKSRYPDLVLVHQVEGQPAAGIVICVEAQKDPNLRKRWRIPSYQASLAEDYELQTWVFVVSFSSRMSEALKAWSLGSPPRVDAQVLDVDTVPRVASLEQALKRPTAAVLAAILHGYEGDLEAARLGVRACRELSEKQRRRYTATILAALPEREREILMGELPVEEQDELWEIERESGTYKVGLRAGLERGRSEGLERGRSEGLERGRSEGLERGRRVTLVEMILAILEVRGVPQDPASEARIRGCEELPTLQTWARRAREVARASELFDEA